MTDRTAARVVGALFILATGSFSVSVAVLDPVLGASDYLTQVALGETRVGIGVLLELVNHTAVVGIAVVMYPILKRYSERLAMGYVAARSIEAVLFAVATMHLLTLVPVSQEFVAAGAPSGSHLRSMGHVLLAGHDWNRTPLAFTAFGVGALILNGALYWTRIVPRWISAFGLLAASLILAARLVLLGGVGLSSGAVTMLDGSIFLQEMVFAVWLILRGFDPSVMATPSDSAQMTG